MDMMMSTKEAATELGVSEQRVRALIAAGRLAAKRLGARSYMIDSRALAAVRVRVPGAPKKVRKKV
jgi:excisionase family DNA binding protein